MLTREIKKLLKQFEENETSPDCYTECNNLMVDGFMKLDEACCCIEELESKLLERDKQLNRYTETAETFHTLYAIYLSQANLNEEPAKSAVELYLKQGEEAIRQQFAHNQQEYIRKLLKHIDALEQICNEFIPAEKLDEANSKVILLCEEDIERMGRKMLDFEK